MRLDKLTTKFQEALADAQSLAIGNDHAYIGPVHLLVAMLRQTDGPRALLERAGANANGLLAAAEAAVRKLPQVQGQDQVQGGPELAKVLRPPKKKPSSATTSSLPASCFCWRWPTTRGIWVTWPGPTG